MCQGCLSSGPLKVWSTISHSTLNVKCFDTWLLRCRLPHVRAGCASFYVYFPTANPSSNLTQQRSSQTSRGDAGVPANLKVHTFWWERTRPAPSSNNCSSYSSLFSLHQSLTTKEEGVKWSTHPVWVPAHPAGQSRCAPLSHLIKTRSRITVHLPLTHRSCSHSSTISKSIIK